MADSKKYDGSQWEHSLRKQTTASEIIVPPTTIYADGTAISTYTIKGNTVQSGTPTPSNPVSVNGVGDKTANLLDVTLFHNGYHINSQGVIETFTGRIATTTPIDVSNYTSVTFSYTTTRDNDNFIYATFSGNTLVECVSGKTSGFAIDTTNCDKLYLSLYNLSSQVSTADIITAMLNSGSTAKPYEPYGFKIPILTNQTTTNIYIGDNPLRKSLDGTAYDTLDSNGTLTQRVDSDGSVLATPIVSQITVPSIPTVDGANTITIDTTVQPSEFTATWTGWHDTSVKEKSENLWNEDYTDISSTAKYVPLNVGEGNFTLSTTFQAVNNVTDIFLLSGNVTSGISSSDNGAYAGKNVTKASIDGYVTIAYRNYARTTTGSIQTCQTMLNSGSTAQTYAPYWE